MRILSATVGVAMLASASTALSESAPHVHGVGVLNLAVEGKSVIIELVSPASDIVGFEHKPHDGEERKAVEAAVETLKKGERLFQFPKDAGCREKETEVETGLQEDDDHDHGKSHDTHAETHAEFHAHYRFECSRPDALDYVDIDYFSKFSRAKELEVRTITPRGQGATELTPRASRLTF